MKLELDDKTQMDLLDMRMQINAALENYGNRAKTKVYSNFIPFEGWQHYLSEDNARAALIEAIEDGIYSDDEFKIKCSYLNDAELEYCRDYYQVTGK
jgi:hypothetical protein